MNRILAAALVAMPALLSANQASAQGNNPWSNRYNQWNQNMPGYSNYPTEIRRQIRDMNPYRESYNDWNRQYRSVYRRSSGW